MGNKLGGDWFSDLGSGIGGMGYLCAACWPTELGPNDFILPTIKVAGQRGGGQKGGMPLDVFAL
jgi:hypothetical protein